MESPPDELREIRVRGRARARLYLATTAFMPVGLAVGAFGLAGAWRAAKAADEERHPATGSRVGPDRKGGRPCRRPPRMTFTMTQGTSAMTAKPRFSCISENPGPLVAVIALVPAR